MVYTVQVEIDVQTALSWAGVIGLWAIKTLVHQVKLIFKRLDHIRHHLLKHDPNYTEEDNE